MERFLRPERFDVDPSSNSASQEWEHWKKTFQNFLVAQLPEPAAETAEDLKLQLLINHVSSQVFTFISESTSYTEALAILNTLYVKPKNIVYARHLLATRKQRTDETVDKYMQALKQLSKDCQFTAVDADTNRNDSIRDAFISGIISSKIRQRLLENLTLSLSEAYNQALSLETAEVNAQNFISYSVNAVPDDHGPSTSTYANDIKNENTVAASFRKRKCFFCGGHVHQRKICPALNANCQLCGKKGHYANVCRSKDSSSAALLEAGENSSCISAAAPPSLRKTIVPAIIKGIRAEALLDTGSSMGFMIIGHDVLGKHSTLEFTFGGPKDPLVVCNVAEASVPAVPLFTNVTEDCRPIAVKSRRYSEEDKQFIKQELQKLLTEGIIEESQSPWRAQCLITNTANHKKRLVIDYSQTINRYTELDAYPLPNIEELVSSISKYTFFSAIDLQSAYHQVPILQHERPYTAFEAAGNLYQFRRIPFGVTNGVSSFQRTIDWVIRKEQLKGTYAYLDDVTICGNTQEEHDQNLDNFLKAAAKYGLTLNKNKCKFSQRSINILGYNISNHIIKPDEDRLMPLVSLPPPNDIASLRRALGMFAHYSKWIPNFSEQIHILSKAVTFPLTKEQIERFEDLKVSIAKSSVHAIDDKIPFTVETDASEHSIAAVLSQNSRPVAFFSRTLNASEQNHSAIEKEAYAIVESVKKWRHYLIGRTFHLITDQRSVSFMFNMKHSSKVKNEKIQRWRLELSQYKYDIIYRPGKDNFAADTLTRVCASAEIRMTKLSSLHEALCHPGVTRMNHWIKSKNLPYSLDEIRTMTNTCRTCCEIKPRFFRTQSDTQNKLVKATSPFERLSMDFKGPLPTNTNNRYLLVVIDEYSRFPFAFACSDMTSKTVITHLNNLFMIFGFPTYVHSDRGTSFLAGEVQEFLHSRGIATSHSSPYNPRGNGQVEKLNSTLWRTIQLALKTKNLPVENWERVLPQALHSIRSLLCTATNSTPHERMFFHPRRSSNGTSIPSWLTNSGQVLVKRFNRSNKYQDMVEEVDLIHSNPDYSLVRFPDGREANISNRYLAPLPDLSLRNEDSLVQTSVPDIPTDGAPVDEPRLVSEPSTIKEPHDTEPNLLDSKVEPRKSTRLRRQPKYLQDYQCEKPSPGE